MNALARDVIRHLQTLTISQGQGAGDPFVVLPWERRFISGALRSGVSAAAISIARGNGKTTLVAGIAHAAL